MFLALFAFLFVDIALLIIFRKSKNMYVITLQIFGIVFLAIMSMFYIAKFSNYTFMFRMDYNIYLYIQRMQVHPSLINNIYVFAHCVYLSASLYFLKNNVNVSKRALLLETLPVIYFFIVNLSSFSWNVFMFLHTSQKYEPMLTGLLSLLFRGGSHVIILIYAFIPIFFSVGTYLKTENMITKSYYCTYIICLLLNLLVYLSIFIYGAFSSFSPQNLDFSKIPDPFFIKTGILLPMVFMIILIGAATIILMYYRPFKTRTASSGSIKSKDFQRIQYKHYFAQLHMTKNALLSVYKYIESAEQFIENKNALMRLEFAKKSIDEQFTLYQSLVANINPQAIRFELLNLNDLLETAIRNTAFDSDIILQKNIFEGNIYLIGDEKHLVNAFENIIQNSIHSLRISSRNDKTISVEMIPDGDFALIKFTDNGIGISKNDKKYIFNLFYTTGANKFCGGIGLFYTKDIIKRHKGDIWFRSNSEETQFVIALPISKISTP